MARHDSQSYAAELEVLSKDEVNGFVLLVRHVLPVRWILVHAISPFVAVDVQIERTIYSERSSARIHRTNVKCDHRK